MPSRTPARSPAPAALNAAFAHGAMVSANTTFFQRPMANRRMPSAIFSQLKRYVAGSENCGIISLWWSTGPAIRCGKKVTKST